MGGNTHVGSEEAKLFKESSSVVVCHSVMAPRVLPEVTVLLAVLGAAAAFLATPLNTTDPDVAAILCPEQVLTPTKGSSYTFIGPAMNHRLYWRVNKKRS